MNDVVPAGDYATARLAGGLVFTAGMTPRVGGEVVDPGRVGAEVPVARARELVALAATRAVTAAREAAAAAGLRLTEAASLTVYLRTGPEFTEHAAVADGVSEAIRTGPDAALPARSTVGVASLPSGAAVELAAVFATAKAPATDAHPPSD